MVAGLAATPTVDGGSVGVAVVLPIMAGAMEPRFFSTFGRTEQTNVKFHRLTESAVKTSNQAFFDVICTKFLSLFIA